MDTKPPYQNKNCQLLKMNSTAGKNEFANWQKQIQQLAVT